MERKNVAEQLNKKERSALGVFAVTFWQRLDRLAVGEMTRVPFIKGHPYAPFEVTFKDTPTLGALFLSALLLPPLFIRELWMRNHARRVQGLDDGESQKSPNTIDMNAWRELARSAEEKGVGTESQVRVLLDTDHDPKT